jgi:hypothetical protein
MKVAWTLLFVSWLATAAMAGSLAGISAPTKLKATEASDSTVTLYWETPQQKGSGLAGYKIYRNDAVIATVSQYTNQYRDTELAPSTTYTYKVVAFDTSKQESPASISATAKTHAVKGKPTTKADPGGKQSATPAAAAAPQNLKTKNVTATAAVLTWDPPKNSASVAGYRLYRGESNGTEIVWTLLALVPAGTTTYADDGLRPDWRYSYTVSAFDQSQVDSAKSAELTFRTLQKK